MARIGLNAHLYSPQSSYRSAGVSRYIERLLMHLPAVDPGSSYFGWTNGDVGAWPGWQLSPSGRTGGSPLTRILWEQTGLPRSARALRLDLLHAPVYAGPRMAPCPQVVTLHDLSFYLYPELFRRSNRVYLQRATRMTARRAARVIAVSESTRQDAIRLLDLPAEKVVTIPNGVDTEMRPLPDDAPERQALRERHGLEGPFMLYVGTLEPRKNLVTLVEAYGKLIQTHLVPHQLVIGGAKGWFYQSVFERVEELGLAPDVRFLGYLPQNELALWYNLADAFVYPSLYEGFGLPPLEAMACGTAVITSNVSALPEVVGQAGITVDPHDVDGLCEAMWRLVSDQALRRDLGRAGMERARRFRWIETAQSTARLYHKVLEG